MPDAINVVIPKSFDLVMNRLKNAVKHSLLIFIPL